MKLKNRYFQKIIATVQLNEAGIVLSDHMCAVVIVIVNVHIPNSLPFPSRRKGSRNDTH